jgi:pyruvate/2-oxoglutarate dehydrogenase complex dihydrolipoamide dehydrogenase (E3) component
MADVEQYDDLVLGSGEAGKYIAWSEGRLGRRVGVIEQKYVGGSCPNIACLPSKNIIHSAKVASYFQRSEEFGIKKDEWEIQMAGVRERKRAMVNGLIDTHLKNFKSSGAELIWGHGRFIAPKTIAVELADGGERLVSAERIIISTGSRATIEDIPGLRAARPMTHIEALELDFVPDHLIVVGGGFVGLEIAQALRRFGSRVTILERNARLAHREDPDVSEALNQLCIDEGIDVRTGSQITSVEGLSGKAVLVHTTQHGVATAIKGTELLIAAGRTSNTEGIGLELAGVEVTAHGDVKVNERLETTAEGVWAVGDCAGSPHFTHVAYDDYRIIRDNFAGGHRVTTGRQVPSCLFTDPELARIGMNETEAKEQGVSYRLVKVLMEAVLRTRTLSESRGFMKALIDTKSDRVLGFTAFGTGAGETMSTVQLAMSAGLPYTALRDCIFTHPTLAEGLVVLFSSSLKTP